jgi:hypothetical protein
MLVVEAILITASILEYVTVVKFKLSPAFRPTVAGNGSSSPLVE